MGKSDEEFYSWAVAGFYVLAVLTFLVVSKFAAPYGRHLRRGWGPSLAAVEGWVLMESPALWATFWVYSFGRHRAELVPRVMMKLYQLHYIHRALIFPFRMRADGKKMPIVVAVAGLLFNVYNGYLQARWLSHYGKYSLSWFASPQFVLGLLLFAAGMVINIWADTVLINLRHSNVDGSYRIPRGWLFEVVTCPNYLGESLEWLGWAVMTWSLPGLAFFLATLANLLPRALAHRSWYGNKFADFPKKRKALIPYVL